MTNFVHSLQRRSSVRGKTFLPTIWRIPSLIFAGFGLLALFAADDTGFEDWFVLGWICASALIYAVIVLYRGFRDGAVRVLTDPFLILVGAFSLYFLFGPLLLVAGPDDQAVYALQWYPTNAQDAVRVTAMNLIGLATTLFAGTFFLSYRIEKAVKPIVTFFGKLSTRKVFWLFLLVGLTAKLNVLIADISATSDIVVLGTIRTLAGLTQLAILVGILYKGRGERLIHTVAITMALGDSAMGLLLFNKSAALMPIVVLFLGFYLRWPTLKVTVVAVAVLGAFFLFLAKPVGEARSTFAESGDQSISARIQVLKEVFESNQTSGYGSGWWSRLCYTPSQVAAMDLYERNQGGEDVELLAWVFVPRVLVPHKPIITRSGVDFNEKVTGAATSSTGIGLFASGYYNLGWPGLLMASTLAGWILATFAAISRAAVLSNSMIMLPVGLLGSYMAFRVDGHFVADYLGPFSMVMVPFLVFIFVLRVGALRNISEQAR